MAGLTTAGKNALATALSTLAGYAALFTTAPSGDTPGTEVSGGTPAYARKQLTWNTAANGQITGTATFDVPAGTTIVGAGLYSAATGGTYEGGGTVTSQPVNTQGQYVLTVPYTQS